MKYNEPLTEFLRIRSGKTLKSDLEELAKLNRRELSDFIRLELEKIVEQSKAKK